MASVEHTLYFQFTHFEKYLDERSKPGYLEVPVRFTREVHKVRFKIVSSPNKLDQKIIDLATGVAIDMWIKQSDPRKHEANLNLVERYKALKEGGFESFHFSVSYRDKGSDEKGITLDFPAKDTLQKVKK